MRKLKKTQLTIALPSKGRMKEPSFKLLEDMRIKAKMNGNRKLLVPTYKPGVRILMAFTEDIPLLVERGAADLGITGKDCITERSSRVEILLELDFGICEVCLAGPRGLKNPKSIATALPNITAEYCREKGLEAEIIRLGGALEAAPRLGIAEAIADQVETGTTLAENKLRVLDVIMETRMCLIGNYESLEKKADACSKIVLWAKGVIDARNRLLVKVNAATDEIRDVLTKLLPAMKSPDVAPLADGGYSLAAAVPRKGIEDLVVKLKEAGGTDIVLSELKMVVP